MSVKIMYFVHGTTTDNEQDVFSGWNSVELSALGITQSKELQQKIQDFWGEKKFDLVICSDLVRAKQSTELTWGGSGVEIIYDARLREIDSGDHTNMKMSEIMSIQNKYVDTRFPNGESYTDLNNRITDLLSWIEKNYQNKSVAFVSHQGPQLALDHILKGWSWEECFEKDWRKTKSWQPGWEYKL